jgi:hypothetical protein
MSHINQYVLQNLFFFVCVSNVSFKLRIIATVINNGKCLSVSPGSFGAVVSFSD